MIIVYRTQSLCRVELKSVLLSKTTPRLSANVRTAYLPGSM